MYGAVEGATRYFRISYFIGGKREKTAFRTNQGRLLEGV